VAQEYRQIVDGFYGQLAGAVTAVATSIVDAAFTTLPTITGTANYVPLAFTDSTLHLTEIMWVTAHAAGSSTVTVVRAKEGTTARAWTTGTPFAQAETRRDGLLPVTSGTIPSDLHVGARWVETDTGLVKTKTFTAGNVADRGVALPSQVGPSRSGAFPAAGDTITTRGGHVVVTTNSNGDGSVAFRVAFPLGCLAVTANSGDAVSFVGFVTITNESATGFDFRAQQTSAIPHVGILRLQYTALGW
jgi:hypothetical protein